MRTQPGQRGQGGGGGIGGHIDRNLYVCVFSLPGAHVQCYVQVGL